MIGTHPARHEAALLVQQGWTLLNAGDHQAALAVSDRLLSEFDLSPEALLLAGEVHFARANFVQSAKIAENCMREFPDDLSGPVLLCRAHLAMGRLGEARDLALETAKRDVSSEQHINILVTALTGCMEPEAAYPLCRQAVDRDPFNAAAQRRLALVCRMTGAFDEAVAAADVALKFNPHDYEMIGLRSAVQAATPDANHIVELEALLAGGCANALGAARVAYALSKECEEVGDYRRAFGFLEAGARFKRQTIRYDVAVDIDAMQMIAATYTREALDELGTGHDSAEPIFILGLPRTGSTLLERILSSHSAVYAAGELRHFSAALMTEVRAGGDFADRAELLRRTLDVDPAEVGRRYIERTRPFTLGHERFIDKYPPNFHNVGMIRSALPDAAIIHLRRTPMDACYAIFKFHFNEAYPWSYDLDELVRYYIAYRRLMDHWREMLPGGIIEVRYEDIVEDIETTTRGLLGRLGLDWEDACIQFHENTAAAMTGSAAQVRKELYRSSVGRWRHYEEQLAPVAKALEDAGIDPYAP